MPVAPYTEPQIAPNVGIPWPQRVEGRIAEIERRCDAFQQDILFARQKVNAEELRLDAIEDTVNELAGRCDSFYRKFLTVDFRIDDWDKRNAELFVMCGNLKHNTVAAHDERLSVLERTVGGLSVMHGSIMDTGSSAHSDERIRMLMFEQSLADLRQSVREMQAVQQVSIAQMEMRATQASDVQQEDARTVPAEWLRGTEQRLHGLERRCEALLRRLVEAEDLLHEVAALHGMDKDDE